MPLLQLFKQLSYIELTFGNEMNSELYNNKIK